MRFQPDLHSGSLILVNARCPLPDTGGEHWISIGREITLERKAAAVLSCLLEDIGSGDAIVPVSGYRSKREQEKIYADSLRDNGPEFTKSYVALPGHSEHQTGLAVDLGLRKEEIDFIRPDFPYEGICQTFREAAPRYGFIERYPKGKEAVTGISHEPWHFRYVGFPHSVLMARDGLTLEEYLAAVRERQREGKHLLETVCGRRFAIFYLPASEAYRFSPPKDKAYEISGTNTDGFVVTVWEG